MQLFEVVRRCEVLLGSCENSPRTNCSLVGGELHDAYTHFLEHFLPHMKQEEQEFQVTLGSY